jgi:hypothetical protein
MIHVYLNFSLQLLDITTSFSYSIYGLSSKKRNLETEYGESLLKTTIRCAATSSRGNKILVLFKKDMQLHQR